LPAHVIPELCTGCGACARACPEEAIRLVGGTASVDESKCRDCEACLEECLQGAMTFVERSA